MSTSVNIGASENVESMENHDYPMDNRVPRDSPAKPCPLHSSPPPASISPVICPRREDLLHVDKNVRCPEPGCGLVFKQSSALRFHVVRKHFRNRVTQPDIRDDAVYLCPDHEQCARPAFGTIKALKQHYQKMHAPRTFACPVCEKASFASEALLRAHRVDCGLRFSCPCGAEFARKQALKLHVAKRHAESDRCTIDMLLRRRTILPRSVALVPLPQLICETTPRLLAYAPVKFTAREVSTQTTGKIQVNKFHFVNVGTQTTNVERTPAPESVSNAGVDWAEQQDVMEKESALSDVLPSEINVVDPVPDSPPSRDEPCVIPSRIQPPTLPPPEQASSPGSAYTDATRGGVFTVSAQDRLWPAATPPLASIETQTEVTPTLQALLWPDPDPEPGSGNNASWVHMGCQTTSVPVPDDEAAEAPQGERTQAETFSAETQTLPWLDEEEQLFPELCELTGTDTETQTRWLTDDSQTQTNWIGGSAAADGELMTTQTQTQWVAADGELMSSQTQTLPWFDEFPNSLMTSETQTPWLSPLAASDSPMTSRGNQLTHTETQTCLLCLGPCSCWSD